MKRTILVVLMAVLIATPSLAQEVETDGLFSLHGTRWESIPPIVGLGFYEGKVYFDCVLIRSPSGFGMLDPSFYMDLLAVSFFISTTPCCGGCIFEGIMSGVIQPVGIGMVAVGVIPALLIKVENNWTP